MAKNFEDMGLIEMAKTLGDMGKELKASGYGECHACYGEPQYHDINTCKCRCHCRACLNGFKTGGGRSMKIHLHDMETGIICDEEGLAIADCNVSPRIEKQVKANAAYIVTAVNAHEELLDLMKYIVAHEGNINYETMFDWLKKAIAKAEGK